MPPPLQACETEPCGELISLRDKVAKQERRINTAIDAAEIMRAVSERVGVMRPDGTCTPHSLTSAVQQLGNQVLALKRTIEERASSDPPPRLLDALGDMSEASRLDIERPDLAIKRRRRAIKQRNWMAIGGGLVAFATGAYEALRAIGVLK